MGSRITSEHHYQSAGEMLYTFEVLIISVVESP